MTAITLVTIPSSIVEDLTHVVWKTTMEEEMQDLKVNGTWDLVPTPVVVGCTTSNFYLTAERLKAQLVAKGYI